MQPKQIRWVKAVVFIACLIPLARLAWLGFHNHLGANPIEYITHSTGWWTLAFLLITLSVTPLRRLLNLPWLLRLRRMLGLFAFFYVSLHFITYIWLDQFFDWTEIVKDVGKRPFITVGFSAFVLLIPLAVTSTNAMVKRLGAKRWQILHRLVYGIGILGVLHFWWLVKKDITEPYMFASLLALLLIIRLLYLLKQQRSASPPSVARSQVV
ncbi:MAG TPA: protein-methionine-sulfoxide reductase heme-binding subunit MsrQ [Burkholderiales bacterium]|jgi:sulfoxide reductase heme-binding subunit YedZ|nr:protein-methionine-sulfoxide reductase heme-binding subunit MsrQ [Burkholderiales bacterium]